MSKGKNYMQHKPRSYVPTKVMGVRADEFFWDSVEEIASRENLSRNGLIIKVMSEYIMNYGNGSK